jgi:predicted metal-dependent peptidase
MKLDDKIVLKKIDYWAERLGVSNFKIEYTISEDSSQDDIGTMADISISLAYSNAHITLFSPAIQDINQLNETIAHEILHIVLENATSMLHQSMGRKYSDLVVDTIENAIEKIVPALIKNKSK